MAHIRRTNKDIENLTIKDAEVIFKNFSGRRKESNGKVVNEEGNRNFCVILPDGVAEKLQDDGWNVRILRPRDEGEEARYYLSVAVNYNYRIPPEIHMLSGHKDTLLDEDDVDTLDYAEIKKIGLTIRPRIWGDNNEKIKAYLKSMVVELETDELMDAYRDRLEDRDDDLPFVD
jgi:hypothetical protein